MGFQEYRPKLVHAGRIKNESMSEGDEDTRPLSKSTCNYFKITSANILLRINFK